MSQRDCFCGFGRVRAVPAGRGSEIDENREVGASVWGQVVVEMEVKMLVVV